ncbi:MAG TPA: ATP-dependent DNA helicase RecG, partial [Firmicutes bacterium]|nr:ATP-dependent DNA helicase RecG [Bacillota bacterium]
MERRSTGHPIDTNAVKEIWDLTRIPVRFIKGVGPKNAEKLLRLGIEDVAGLLFHLPVAYQDRRTVTPLNRIDPEKSQSFIVRLGAVREMRSRAGRRIVRAEAYDGTGSVDLVWFTFPRYLRAILQPGKEYLVFGKADYFRGVPQITHPEITPWEEGDALPGYLLPLYPLTAGITHAYLRKIIRYTLEEYRTAFRDTFPREMEEVLPYPGLEKAFWDLHFPADEADAERARQRLAFDELFYFNLIMQKRKEEKARVKKKPYRISVDMRKRFLASLPFTLTDSQKKVMREIEGDFTGSGLMYRLLQGDVGCGKTVLAAYALYCAVANGYQGAFMAPTGILARQHYDNLTRYLAPLGVETVLLTGGMSKGEKKTALEKCASGGCGVVIGTHALLYDSVEFSALDMVVIDEQHKFGVAQRKSLQLKGSLPHYLLMTATPIPRTLALTIYGNLDLSVINELPPGRKKPKTKLVEPQERKKAYDFIKDQIKQGRQAYVVCPLIEESDPLR